MKPSLHLEIPCLNLERGMISIWVSAILLVASWIAANLYLQSSLALKMATNAASQLTQHVETNNQVRNALSTLQLSLNRDFKADPQSYFVKFRESYPNDFLGCVDTDGIVTDCTREGRVICRRRIGDYDISYAFPLFISLASPLAVQPTHNNIHVNILAYVLKP